MKRLTTALQLCALALILCAAAFAEYIPALVLLCALAGCLEFAVCRLN